MNESFLLSTCSTKTSLISVFQCYNMVLMILIMQTQYTFCICKLFSICIFFLLFSYIITHAKKWICFKSIFFFFDDKRISKKAFLEQVLCFSLKKKSYSPAKDINSTLFLILIDLSFLWLRFLKNMHKQRTCN